MEHKGLRITRQQLKQISKLRSIGEVAHEFYGDKSFTNVDEYFVPYEFVRTEDLIRMMRKITIFNYFMYDLKIPTNKQLDRLTYLDLISEYSGIDKEVSEKEFSAIKKLIRNEKFLRSKDEIALKLRSVISTREHIPNKVDKKIIRRLKSQGRYIID